MQMIIEKCVNIPIIQKSFINIFKNNDVKIIKTSAKIIVTITVKNTVIHNALNCQTTSKRKINVKIRKTFLIYLKLS